MQSPQCAKLALITLLFCATTFNLFDSVDPTPIITVTRFDDEFPQYDPLSGTPYKNCGGAKAVLKSVQVIPCDMKTEDRCVLERGGNVTFNMQFLTNENSQTLHVKLYGIIDYIPVSFPCPQPNACENSGITCPIVKGQLYNYTLSAFVSPHYPRTKLWIKGELMDDNNNILVCVEIPLKIE